jgi:hypothetical protein
VKTTYATLLEALTYVTANADEVMQVVAASKQPRDKIAVRSKLEAFAEPIEIPTMTPRVPDGAPTSVKVKYLANFVGSTLVDRPAAYVVPANVGAHLKQHGLSVEDASGVQSVRVAKVTGFGSEGGRKILEAAKVGELDVEWRGEKRDTQGMMKVSTDQPLGAIAVYLCEPESDDGVLENDLVAAPSLGDDFPIWRVDR